MSFSVVIFEDNAKIVNVVHENKKKAKKFLETHGGGGRMNKTAGSGVYTIHPL